MRIWVIIWGFVGFCGDTFCIGGLGDLVGFWGSLEGVGILGLSLNEERTSTLQFAERFFLYFFFLLMSIVAKTLFISLIL